MVIGCCVSLLGLLHVCIGAVVITTNLVSERFHHIVFWLSLFFIFLGVFSIFSGCNKSVFVNVLISLLSVICIIVSCFIINDTFLSWKIDIWNIDQWKQWDYLRPQHIYMETQIAASILEIVLDMLSGCLSYANANGKKQKKRKVRSGDKGKNKKSILVEENYELADIEVS